ncbi:MAG TPA: MMPL family transporter [Bacilli bacterium]
MSLSILKQINDFVSGKAGKWVTLLAWIILAGVLNSVFPQANSLVIDNTASLSDKMPSVQAEAVEKREFPDESGVPALIVWHRENGLQSDDLAAIQAVAKYFTESPLTGQSFVVPLHKLPAPALQKQVSSDGSTLVMPLFFQQNTDEDQLNASMRQFQTKTIALLNSDPFAAQISDSAALSARITGPVGISIDAKDLFKRADVSLLIATVLLVLIILLLIYRSPILALIPLVAVGFAYGVVNPVIGRLAEIGLIDVDSQALSIMTVLLFGAGTDYCLFLINRFRQALGAEKSIKTALLQSVKGVSGAIAMSGITVVISMFTLLLAKFGFYHRFAIPFGLAVLVMVLASLTLVPALLAIFGRVSFYPFIPRTPEMARDWAARKGKPAPKLKEPHRFGMALGGKIVQKPLLVAAITVIALGGLAVFAAQTKFTYDTFSAFPSSMPSREGFALIGDKFSQGELAPVKVMIQTEGKDISVQTALQKLDYIAKISGPQNGKQNPDIVAYQLELKFNPFSNDAIDRIPELREKLTAAVSAAGIGDAAHKVWIGGQTANQYDIRQVSSDDAQRIIPVIIVLISLLLFFYLRSVTATIYLILTVLLSYFSALGLGWLIVHYLLGAEAIQGFIPLYAFVFLVALGEDYNIFMVSSIWKNSRHVPLRQAVRQGVAHTGSVITSAGIILAGTFAVLASLPIQILVHFGIITAVGVILDTFIVRPFLVPALTVLLGRFAFWPGKTPQIEHPIQNRGG